MGLLLFRKKTSNPRTLFASGEQGGYYDPSVANTLFQLSDGVTAATQPGDPVGLILDSRKGGLSNLGSDLVTNGAFAADSDWTKGANWTIGSGVATKTGGAANNLTQTIASTAGAWYRLTMDVTRTAGTLTVSLGTSGTTYAISASGTYTFMILAGSSTQTLTLAGDSSFAGTVDNVTAKNVPGNHLYQPVSGSRGSLSREPESLAGTTGGKRNLLTYTEQFDNAAWNKNVSTITSNAAVAPDGTTTADTLTATAQYGNTNQQSSQSNTSFTFSLYAKKAGSFAELEIGLASANNYINGCAALFNLTTGTYTSQRTFGSGYSISSYSISDAGNGWYRLVVTGAISVAAAPFAWTGLGINSVNGSTMNIWGAQLETGSTVTAYQKNTTQYDCTEAGKRDCWAIDFDGSDDSYLTSSVDFSGTDKMTVWAGVWKRSDAANACIAELSATYASNASTFAFFTGTPSGAGGEVHLSSRGAALAAATQAGVSSAFASPVSLVATGTANISGDTSAMRINGAASGTTGTGDQGSGNYGNYPLYVGRRNNASFPFSGRIYGLIIRGVQTTDSKVREFEKYVARITGRQI